MFWGGQKKDFVVVTYTGSQASAEEEFRDDSLKRAADGYYPIKETWEAGSYGFFDFFIALMLCIIVIGLLVFLYMLLVKPSGTLTVTYQLKG